MLFTVDNHIELIIKGIKTQTSRISKNWQMQVGKEYRATRKMFTPKSKAVIIKCVRRWEQPIANINKYDALAEGNYTPVSFIRLWIAMHEKKHGLNCVFIPVKRYEFKFVRDNREILNLFPFGEVRVEL